MFSIWVGREPSLVCFHIQLVILYCFGAESGSYRPGFCVAFLRVTGSPHFGTPFSLYAWLQLSCYRQFLYFQTLCQMDQICGMDSKEDVKDLCRLPPGLDTVKIIMLLLCAERTFHRCDPHPCKLLSHKVSLLLLLRRASPFYERSLDSFPLAVVTVCGTGITGVSTYLFHIHPK